MFCRKSRHQRLLVHELGPQNVGKVFDSKGNDVGTHDGAIFYTTGQRHGLDIGGGLPYYVIGKDMNKNEVYVTTDINDKNLWSKEINLTDIHWINSPPVENMMVQVRSRHRAQLIEAKLYLKDQLVKVELTDDIRALTTGQSCVIYQDDLVLGGGIII